MRLSRWKTKAQGSFAWVARYAAVWRAIGWVLLAVLGLATAIMAVKIGASLLADTNRLKDPAKKAEELGRARTAVLAILAGGIAVVGAVYTHRGFELSRLGQITERFTRAVDQLGNGSPDVRIGGIYALERLARESRDDHGPIMEILTAFVRERCRIPDDEVLDDYAQDPEFPPPPAADVAAALTVIGRRTVAHDPPAPWQLNLASTLLAKAQLSGANFAGANFDRAFLMNVDLSDARLAGASLRRARLYGANLDRADLRDAVLVSAWMGEASLFAARLDGARLTRARLPEADLSMASLVGASLPGTDLSSTGLDEADLDGARYTDATRWPPDFDPRAAGARRRGASSAAE